MKTVAYYLECFDNLHCEKNNNQFAPHKAILLLTVFNLFYNKELGGEVIFISKTLKKTFILEWEKYVKNSRLWKPIWITPYYHLKYEDFWYLDERAKKSEKSLISYPATIDLELKNFLLNPYYCRCFYSFVVNRYFNNNDLQQNCQKKPKIIEEIPDKINKLLNYFKNHNFYYQAA